jgi:hypothetical protein
MDGPGQSLAGGGDGAHDPTVEMRLQRLEDTFPRIEALMKSIDERLRKVEIELAELRGRIANLPTTWAMISTMLVGQITLAGFLLAILRVVGTH